MPSAPSRFAESIVGTLIPSACRQEVLGDLYERYRSPFQYGLDAARTIPMVIVSRIRRTADPPLLLIQVLAAYLSFIAGAWLCDPAFLRATWGPTRLAIPASFVVLGLIFEDAYAKPGPRSGWALVRGPLIGLKLALISQAMLFISHPAWSLGGTVTLYGTVMSLILTGTTRAMFAPNPLQLMDKVPNATAETLNRFLYLIAFIAVFAGLSTFTVLRPGPIALLLILLVAVREVKRL